jgi:hypothetical protein
MLTVLFALQKGEQVNGPARRSCERPWCEGRINQNGRLHDGLRGGFQFGSIKIDGVSFKHDVVIDRGKIRKRRKKPSKKFREEFGHPVSAEEEMPWKCQRLIVGTGRYGSLPVMAEVKCEARRREIELLILPADQALETLVKKPKETNAILHVTC